jgi:hypothetical protein
MRGRIVGARWPARERATSPIGWPRLVSVNRADSRHLSSACACGCRISRGRCRDSQRRWRTRRRRNSGTPNQRGRRRRWRHRQRTAVVADLCDSHASLQAFRKSSPRRLGGRTAGVPGARSASYSAPAPDDDATAGRGGAAFAESAGRIESRGTSGGHVAEEPRRREMAPGPVSAPVAT